MKNIITQNLIGLRVKYGDRTSNIYGTNLIYTNEGNNLPNKELKIIKSRKLNNLSKKKVIAAYYK